MAEKYAVGALELLFFQDHKDARLVSLSLDECYRESKSEKKGYSAHSTASRRKSHSAGTIKTDRGEIWWSADSRGSALATADRSIWTRL